MALVTFVINNRSISSQHLLELAIVRHTVREKLFTYSISLIFTTILWNSTITPILRQKLRLKEVHNLPKVLQWLICDKHATLSLPDSKTLTLNFLLMIPTDMSAHTVT